MDLPCTGQGGPWEGGGIKVGPGHTLGLQWEGGTYIPVPSLQLGAFSSCFCPAPSCPSFSHAFFQPFFYSSMCSFFQVSIHASTHPPTYSCMHPFIHPSICPLSFLLPPFPLSPLSSLLLSIYSSSHLPMCLSCLSISSSPSTLLSVHHHPINKHLQSTRGCDLRLHEHDLRASVEDGFLRSGTIGGDQGVTLRQTKRPSCGEGAMGRLGSVPVSRCPVPCPSKESL